MTPPIWLDAAGRATSAADADPTLELASEAGARKGSGRRPGPGGLGAAVPMRPEVPGNTQGSTCTTRLEALRAHVDAIELEGKVPRHGPPRAARSSSRPPAGHHPPPVLPEPSGSRSSRRPACPIASTTRPGTPTRRGCWRRRPTSGGSSSRWDTPGRADGGHLRAPHPDRHPGGGGPRRVSRRAWAAGGPHHLRVHPQPPRNRDSADSANYVDLQVVEGKGFEPSASGVRFQRSPGLS